MDSPEREPRSHNHKVSLGKRKQEIYDTDTDC